MKLARVVLPVATGPLSITLQPVLVCTAWYRPPKGVTGKNGSNVSC